MKRSWIALAVVAAFLTIPALAQEPVVPGPVVSDITVASCQPSPTPQMWFYQQQLEEYMNTKLAIRRKAEAQARQRRARLATSRWFGQSNLRPRATTDPINGCYSSRWGGNNLLVPNLWSGYSCGAGRVALSPRSEIVIR